MSAARCTPLAPISIKSKRSCAAARDARVLDLGCGGGHVSYRVAPHVREVVACDLTPDMLTQVKRAAAERGLSNIVARQGAAERLPFADASFDIVLSRYSAHHWRDFEAGLREAPARAEGGWRAIFWPTRSPPPIPCWIRICRRSNCCAIPRMCATTAPRNGWRRSAARAAPDRLCRRAGCPWSSSRGRNAPDTSRTLRGGDPHAPGASEHRRARAFRDRRRTADSNSIR